jgi:hypothetical protein
MIRFKREGGFVGLSKTKDVDEKDLPEDIRKLLAKLADVKVSSGKSVRRDGFKYTIEIEGEKTTRKYTINEEDVTAAIAPLIAYLDQL